MKSIILFLGLLVIVSCGEYQQRCQGDPACETCSISWLCDYGNSEDLKEECFKDCLEHKIDYDTHSSVQEGQETTVHKKPAFVQIKEESAEKQRCLKSEACEACAISWQCEYGSKPELVEDCYKVCNENKIDFDSHKQATSAEEIKVHQ